MVLTGMSIYEQLKQKLSHVVPDAELRYKAEIADEVNRLKQARNAVILGHNYMEPVLFYSVPDYVGDSLELSRKAAATDKDIIVFCGVRFMAESADIDRVGSSIRSGSLISKQSDPSGMRWSSISSDTQANRRGS